ncbi:MAG: diacylglycerol/lipid kinase family protein [Angustibacter sp.]
MFSQRMSLPVPLLLLGTVILVVATVTALWLLSRDRHRDKRAPAAPHIPQAAIIVNPTKVGNFASTRRRISAVCRTHGWAEPLWFETTQSDSGAGPTRAALATDVDLICALGGDGTVRAVAGEMAHTGRPLGLLPSGTGNLLARNLGSPVTQLEDAVTLALTGRNRVIDVGRISFIGKKTAPEQLFLVMAGVGIDAAMMAETPERLKATVGWMAYALAGVRHSQSPRSRARISADGGAEVTRRVHTVLIGNCGLLTGGIVLLPNARVDDGWLDAVTLSPKGLTGWVSAAAGVISGRGHDRVQMQQLRTVRVEVDYPIQAQIDGDPVGSVLGFSADIDPGALTVRVRG